MKKTVRVFAPATVSNVSCGFDVLGFALDEPGDEVVVTKSHKKGVRITNITGDDGKLPTSAEQNTAGIAVHSLLIQTSADFGVDIEIHKKMPLGSGLGSSAASAVAAVVGTNRLLDTPQTKEELLSHVIVSETKASGTPHPDNAAPCLFGGFVLTRCMQPVDVVPLQIPEDLFCAVILPDVEIHTSESRKLLPEYVPLPKAVRQWANLGALVAGLSAGDYDLISRAMVDEIVEPLRAHTIPGYQPIKDAAINSGATGFSISGSGPAMFTFCEGRKKAETVGQAMLKASKKEGFEALLYISKINHQGPRILEEKDIPA